jgi:hypothetical protein
MDINVGDFVVIKDASDKRVWRVASSIGLPAKLTLKHRVCDSEETTSAWDFQVKLVQKAKSNVKENTMATEKTLYEIKQFDKTVFGHKLAVNSLGQWVMEIKGSGEVIAVDKKEVTEVVPYTIGLKFSQQGQTYNYFNEARDLVKGDVLVMDGYGSGGYQLAIVVAVDTKSKEATKEISYHKKLA